LEQTYHIEALAPDARKGQSVKRMSLRLESQDEAERRAVDLLRVTQMPQWDNGPVEAVRVIDGRGAELFRWTIWDEMSGRSGGR
jgi:hypothetical protein